MTALYLRAVLSGGCHRIGTHNIRRFANLSSYPTGPPRRGSGIHGSLMDGSPGIGLIDWRSLYSTSITTRDERGFLILSWSQVLIRSLVSLDFNRACSLQRRIWTSSHHLLSAAGLLSLWHHLFRFRRAWQPRAALFQSPPTSMADRH